MTKKSDNEETSLPMPIDVYMFWFDILCLNKHEMANYLMCKLSPSEKNRLIGGFFEYQEFDFDISLKLGQIICRNPVSLCIIYGSFAVLSVLLK